MMSCINYCIGSVNDAVQKNITAAVASDKAPAYKLLAGIHYCVRFMGEASSPELATMTLQSVTKAMRESKMSPQFVTNLLNGVDKAKGLTREDIVKYSRTTSTNSLDVQASVG